MKNLHSIKTETPAPPRGNLLQAMHRNTSYGETDNGAKTLTRTMSPLVDFFAQAGAMRNSPDKALDLFQKAYAEDALMAVRALFYLRDIRGGQGERQLFRNCLEWLGTSHQDVFESLIRFVPEYGRFDDLFFDNEVVWSFLGVQLETDKTSENPSLLAKWLKTANASSPHTRAKAKVMAEKLGMNIIEYRKVIRSIRKKIATVEEKMSAQKWSEIDYSTVPSQASRIYKEAFTKHDQERYNTFLQKAIAGEAKINASTLYPHQVYKDVRKGDVLASEALWRNLPDYTRGANALVVADVSGSMEGDPMAVSVSLALYFAERNRGQFQDHFITFSGSPTIQKIHGTTLRDRMNSIEQAEWGFNTNLQSVFNLVLNTAIENNLSQEDMPETLYIISDMEFDQACSDYTNLEVIQSKYEQAGYKCPNIVFWNVNASGRNLPVDESTRGITMVSGFSPSAFSFAVENKTAEELMYDILNSERYQPITI